MTRRPVLSPRRAGAGWTAVAAVAVAAGPGSAPIAAQVAQPGAVPDERPAPSVALSLSKPMMGENYDPLTGLVSVEVRLPRGDDFGWFFDGAFVHSTAGRMRSAVLSNPTVGVWTRVSVIPLEIAVTLPLMRELGDDDFATDVARLSDVQHRERYLSGRWSVAATGGRTLRFGDGSSIGVRLGTVAELPKGDRDLVLRARQEVDLHLRFSPVLSTGAGFRSSVRLTGEGGVDERTLQDLVIFFGAPRVRGQPELSFRIPLDIDLQDYVSGVLTLSVRF